MIPSLTDTAIRNAKPGATPRRLFDGKVIGLHVLIQPAGSKLWRFRYTFGGVEKRLSLGKYPELTLDAARRKALDLGEQIRAGVDPSAPVVVTTFEAVAEKFVEWKSGVLLRSGSTIRKYRECLRNDLLPELGQKDIKDIHAADVVPLLEKIERRSNSLARKNQELVSMIIRYAVQRGFRPPYTTIDLSGVIVRRAGKERMIPEDIQVTFSKINSCASPVMKAAMRLQFLCFLRSSELMGGKWDEIDFKKKEWHIPSERMKMRRPHVVPLSRQSLSVLRDLKILTGGTPYLFPSSHNESSMVRDSLSKSFRSAGLGIDPHRCRRVASTWLRNAGHPPYVVELQLSHAEKNQVVGAYLHRPHLMYMDERKKMMQDWADYLSKR